MMKLTRSVLLHSMWVLLLLGVPACKTRAPDAVDATPTASSDSEDNLRYSGETKDGKYESRKGASSAENVPDWVPRPAKATVKASFQHNKQGEEGGVLLLETGELPADLVRHLSEKLQGEGFTVDSNQTMNAGGQSVVTTTLKNAAKGRSLQIVASQRSKDPTQVQIMFGEKSK